MFNENTGSKPQLDKLKSLQNNYITLPLLRRIFREIMRSFYLMLLSLLLYAQQGYALNKDVLKQLAQTISKTDEYDTNKVRAIEELKQHLVNTNEPLALFSGYRDIYEQYKSFKYDSAYRYAVKMMDQAYIINNAKFINEAKLSLSFVLLSAGLYKETFDSLNTINLSGSDSAFRSQCYILWGRYYYDIASYDYDQYHSTNYDIIGGRYMDSALLFLPPASFEFSYYIGLKSLKMGNSAAAISSLEKIINDPGLTYHQLALATSTLSSLYRDQGNTDKTIELLARAADADIKSSTKEAVAIFHLAELLYKTGDIDYASIFIDYGLVNAEFYDAKQRKIEASSILPLIEAARINAMETKKNQLIEYAIIVTILMLLLIGLSYIVLKQVKRLKMAQAALAEAHVQQQQVNVMLSDANKELGDANDKLAKANDKLAEADKIKEKYIGYFFNSDSDYYDKIEKIKQNIDKKLNEKKYEDIRFYLNKIDAQKEKEELLKNFDKLFLALFPNFPAEINNLLRKEEIIHLKEGELLNTDMRIFAFIRMGISDPEKIASILDYSVKTIYTYKSKLKSKSNIPNDEFEERIMAIKAL